MGAADGVGRRIEQAQAGAGFHQVATFYHQLGQLLIAFAFFLQPGRPFQHQRVGRFFHLALIGTYFGRFGLLFREVESGA